MAGSVGSNSNILKTDSDKDLSSSIYKYFAKWFVRWAVGYIQATVLH